MLVFPMLFMIVIMLLAVPVGIILAIYGLISGYMEGMRQRKQDRLLAEESQT